MSRFRHVQTLALAPGHCFACRKSADPDGFVDLGFSDEWLGAFYVCAACVVEMARLFGMRTLDEVSDLDGELADIRERLAFTNNVVARLYAVRDAIAAYREDVGEILDEPESDLGVSGGTAGGRGRRTSGRASQPVD